MSSPSLDRIGASILVSPSGPATPESLKGSEKEPTRAKRKVSTACDRCRSKKVKCDGKQPVCGPCAKHATDRGECSWRHALVRAKHRASRDDIDRQFRLQQRQKDAPRSSEMRHGPASTTTADAGPVGFDQRSEAWRRGSQPVESESTTSRGRPPLEREWSESLELASSSGGHGGPGKGEPSGGSGGGGGTTEQINAMIGSVSERDQGLGFFGSSSIGSFMTTVRRAVHHHTAEPSEQMQNFARNAAPNATGGRNSATPRTSTPKQHGDAYLLPQRTRADELIKIYWDVMYPIYPVLSQKRFAACYTDLWNGQRHGGDDSEFLCLLNAVFAVATLLDHEIAVQDRKPAAAAFFRRAQDLLVLWSPASLHRVQSFLVLAQYLQSTNESHQCWMFIGYAVRTAESLGLHLPATTGRMADIAQREECRRVWYGCIHMDRILAMVYGRPTVVKQAVATSAPRPLGLDEENFTTARTVDCQPDNDVSAVHEPQIVDFFVQSLDLFDILSEILEEFYELRPAMRPSSAPDEHEAYFGAGLHRGKSLSIVEIDQKLCRWEKSLLPHLREYRAGPDIYARENCPSRQVVLVRQAVVLRQRLLHIRLLSLRPILASFVSFDVDDSQGPPPFASSPGGSLPQRLALQCSVVCCQVAQEAIDLVHSSLPPTWSVPSVTATWWYNVFYVYSAATVLIAAKLAPTIVWELGEASLTRSWQQATDILQAYKPFSDSIPKLVAALQVLDDEVPVRYLQHIQRMASGGTHAFSSTSFNFAANARSQGAEAVPAAPTLFNFPKESGTDEGRVQTGSQFQQQQPSFADPLDSFAGGVMLDDFENMAFDPGDLSWLSTIPFSF